MPRKSHVAVAALLAFMAVPAPGAPFGAVDECLETGLDWGALPGSLPGQIAVIPCPGCSPVLLAVDAGTRFFVGEEEVTAAVVRKYAQRESRQVRVCHDQTRHVTRIKVTGTLDAADRNR